jgi:hypothetical protein
MAALALSYVESPVAVPSLKRVLDETNDSQNREYMLFRRTKHVVVLIEAPFAAASRWEDRVARRVPSSKQF